MTVSDRNPLPQLWSVLTSSPPVGDRLRVLGYRSSPRTVLAALSSDGLHGLLVELASRESAGIPEELSVEQGGTLMATLTALDPDGTGPRRFVHVQCRDHDADQAFDAFCELLEQRVRSVPIGRALRECADEFRRLLAGDAEEASPKVVGLLGELIALRSLVERDPLLIDAWVGPAGGRHDFRRGDRALEVKTTLRSAAKGRVVHISDIDQLEPPVGGTLFLHLVRLERVMDGATSIESLTGEIAGYLGAEARTTFLGTLEGMDLTPAQRRGTYALREQVTYEVRAGFPALTPAHLVGGALIPGVFRVAYDLALESAAAFEVPVETGFSLLAEAT